ncbi:MAG TPA: hypothetical protein VLH85_07335 [Levilinea sp.]|nr:hypothetical protein [Levilinea sp.]
MELPSSTVALATTPGQVCACPPEGCAPTDLQWLASTQPCSEATRPAVVTLFPLLVSWNIDLAFGCELSYQSTGRTMFVIHDR